MCHFTYLLFTCCSEPKEHDGFDLLDVEYCNECPVTAEGYLYDDDFFHCPYATGDCLGDSDFLCPECKEAYAEENNDDLNKDREPYDDFSDYSDAESESNWYPIGTYDGSCCWSGRFARSSDLLEDLSTVRGSILTIDVCTDYEAIDGAREIRFSRFDVPPEWQG